MSIFVPKFGGPTAIQNRLLYERTERRNKGGLEDYKPVNQKAKEFHKSDAMIRCLFGSVRSGKTKTGTADDVSFCEGTHPLQKAGKRPMPPIYGRIVSTDLTHGVEKIIVPNLQSLVTPPKLRGGSWKAAYSVGRYTLTWENGSQLDLMSNESELNRFDGVPRHFIHYDEEPREDVRNRNAKRLIDYGGWEIFTMTPENGCTWIWDTFKQPWDLGNPDGRSLACWTMSIYENPYIPREYIEQREKEITDPEQKRITLYGEFIHRSGLVFGSQYFQNRAPWVYNTFPIPKEWPIWVGIDTANRKETAVIFVAASPSGELWVYDEIFKKAPMSDVASLIRLKVKGHRVISYVVDWASKGQDAEYGISYYDDLINNGIPVTLALKDPKIRIERMWDAFAWNPTIKSDHPVPYDKAWPAVETGGPRLRICKQNAPTLVYQLQRLVWDDYASRRTSERRDQPERWRKKEDDCPDALGYILMEMPKYFASRPRGDDLDDHFVERDTTPMGNMAWWSSDYGARGWRAA